jgi:hypothetical protein
MAEFRYYAVRDDVRQWISELSQEGHYRFVIEYPYFEPNLIEFASLNELDSGQFETARALDILSDRYSQYPSILDGPYEDPDTHQPWYSLSYLRGGPAMRLRILFASEQIEQ